MNEELLNENIFSTLPALRQKELITQSCSKIIALIDHARSLTEAQSIVTVQCAEFDQQCSSALIRSAVRSYLTERMKLRWISSDISG